MHEQNSRLRFLQPYKRFKTMTAEATPLLRVNNIEVIYEHVILVLKGVSLSVQEGQIVSLLGANGAGKSTTLKAISNLVKAERGEVTKGTVEFDGRRIDKLYAPAVVKLGVIQVMEGRHTFVHLTVEDDLLTGAYTRGREKGIRVSLDNVYKYFPRLRERRYAKTGYISGGEMQMCAIGRALMAKPRIMLLDEPSMGLAPLLVKEIFDIIQRLNEEEKVAMLLAEQNAAMALQYAQYGYVMENGRVVLDGDAETLRNNEDVREFYLGLTEIGKKSYRDVKHYRRRKRWLA
jgi:branched-chain amino acid transport system ATP-binding protein